MYDCAHFVDLRLYRCIPLHNLSVVVVVLGMGKMKKEIIAYLPIVMHTRVIKHTFSPETVAILQYVLSHPWRRTKTLRSREESRIESEKTVRKGEAEGACRGVARETETWKKSEERTRHADVQHAHGGQL